MAVNPTISCLQEVTDHFEFERLCSALMSLEGYSSIEPLGGSQDKGRDAIYVNASNQTTIFAYSVNKGWRVKLTEDAEKVHKHGHACNQFVFITTSKITAPQRDEAVAYIKNEFGWQLQLHGIERLRILLDVKHPQIKKQHPGIFHPEFLAAQDRIGNSTNQDHLFISAVDEDGVFADWLTRKLTAEGYLVWYERFQLLGGETFPDDIDDAIKNQTFRFIGLYSRASMKDLEVTRQRLLALNVGSERDQDFLIPLNVDGIDQTQLDQVTRTLKFIPFQDNWAEGLKQLLKKLKSIDCPLSLPNGKFIAAEAFLGNDVRSDEKETLFSNCFRVHQIPKVIYRFKSQKAIEKEKLDKLKSEWSYREIDPYTFLSFHNPPASIIKEYGMTKKGEKGGDLWREVKKPIYRIWPSHLASELIRKALIVKCHQKGLKYCRETERLYFPRDPDKSNRISFTQPDGKKANIAASGKRKHLSGSEYLYSLAPDFFVRQDLFDDFTVLVRIRVRLSDTKGKPLKGHRTIVSRRKHLCKNWWNRDWLNRTLAVSQFLADGDKITIGESEETQIIIDATPLCMNVPVGINEEVLDELSRERSELIRNYDEFSDGDIGDEGIGDN
ncbi:MAG: TIR domain-containing protein [Candidatus Poribacteria bacterium]|nr:TIR domain-containing protein [Candidatus Poribacteria bacterium]